METKLIILIIVGLLQGIVAFPLVYVCFKVVRPRDLGNLIWQIPLALVIIVLAGALVLWLPLILFDRAFRQEHSVYWFFSFFVGMVLTVIASRIAPSRRSPPTIKG